MSGHLNLSELAVGASATVSSFVGTGPITVRLREMGVLPGTKITLVRTAPLGDPLEFKVRGYNLSLRRKDAAMVLVEVEGK
jgi:ferrous iron transport protein A